MLGVVILNILIVCTGNTCRSPIAEGIFRDIADKREVDIVVKSAGLSAERGNAASPNAISSMEDIGIDIKKHQSQPVTKGIIDESDIILTMTTAQKDILIRKHPNKIYNIFSLNEYAFGNDTDIMDPFGGDKALYDKIRDEIMSAIESIYNHM